MTYAEFQKISEEIFWRERSIKELEEGIKKSHEHLKAIREKYDADMDKLRRASVPENLAAWIKESKD